MNADARPTRDQVEEALRLTDSYSAPTSLGSQLAAEVRALRVELAARTPWPVDQGNDGPDVIRSVGTLRRSGGNVDRWDGRRWVPTVITAGSTRQEPWSEDAAPLPAVPDGEDDDRPVRWAWAAWLAESAEQADDLDNSERHGLRIAATHLLEDDIAARLTPGDYNPVADPAWALRFSARLWADVETGRAALRVDRLTDSEDVPARLDAAADALAKTGGWQYPIDEVRRVAGILRNVSPTARAAIAAALSRPGALSS